MAELAYIALYRSCRLTSVVPSLSCEAQALKEAGVEVIVAPYEADAQMAFLAKSRAVHAVITEDSDLLTYGCPRVRASCAHRCASALAAIRDVNFSSDPVRRPERA